MNFSILSPFWVTISEIKIKIKHPPKTTSFNVPISFFMHLKGLKVLNLICHTSSVIMSGEFPKKIQRLPSSPSYHKIYAIRNKLKTAQSPITEQNISTLFHPSSTNFSHHCKNPELKKTAPRVHKFRISYAHVPFSMIDLLLIYPRVNTSGIRNLPHSNSTSLSSEETIEENTFASKTRSLIPPWNKTNKETLRQYSTESDLEPDTWLH